MKNGGMLNKRLCEVIVNLGHMDTIVICDAGLPISDENQRVDLSFEPGTLGQIQGLKAVLKEIGVEKVIMAKESKEVSPKMHEDVLKLLGDREIEHIPYVGFKEKSKKAKAIIRSGEFISYPNVIIVCGCAY
jgi:D-ribose pyranase